MQSAPLIAFAVICCHMLAGRHDLTSGNMRQAHCVWGMGAPGLVSAGDPERTLHCALASVLVGEPGWDTKSQPRVVSDCTSSRGSRSPRTPVEGPKKASWIENRPVHSIKN